MIGARDIDRDVYRLLVYEHPLGIHRDQLGATLGVDDRSARASIERVRLLAATHPHPQKGAQIVGFDPATERYVAAQNPEQAKRVLAYQHSRVEALAAPLHAQVDAYRERFGELPDRDMQQTLFDARQLGRKLPEVRHET